MADSRAGIGSVTFILATCALGASPDRWETQLADAQRTYDLALAERVLDSLPAAEASPLLYARTLLLVGELQRIAYEELPAQAWSRRRELGNAIDRAAEAGLRALAAEPESSELWRVRADLYGLMIRTDFQAAKFRAKMIDAADRAIEADGSNSLGYLSQAKPYVFAPPGRGQDFDEAIRLIDHALSLDPNLESAMLLKAYTLRERGDDAAALNLVDRVLQRNPACAPAIRLRAQLVGKRAEK